MNSHEVFIDIHQGCFAGTGAIVRLPQCQWSKPDGYGKISQCITTTKHSKAKTVCIFLGIYCNNDNHKQIDCVRQRNGIEIHNRVIDDPCQAILNPTHNIPMIGNLFWRNCLMCDKNIQYIPRNMHTVFAFCAVQRCSGSAILPNYPVQQVRDLGSLSCRDVSRGRFPWSLSSHAMASGSTVCATMLSPTCGFGHHSSPYLLS